MGLVIPAKLNGAGGMVLENATDTRGKRVKLWEAGSGVPDAAYPLLPNDAARAPARGVLIGNPGTAYGAERQRLAYALEA